MTAMSGYRLDFNLPQEGILVSLLVVLGISQLAAILPAMRAARTRILTAIQYE
jgi:ABC-type lipoprotein release transport system permease subunit